MHEWLLRYGRYGSALLGVSAVLLIWMGAIYFTHTERQQTERAAMYNAGNLARAFEEQIIRSIRAVDQTLLYVRDSYARDPKNFDMSLWSRNSQFLTDFAFQLAIIGADGRMVASNIPGSKAGVDLSDREHFHVHASRQSDALFISKPVLGRVSQKWSIQITRRITMPNGAFGGVVVVSLDPDYLAQFYKSIDIGSQGSITLVGLDGIVRARGANAPSAVGESVAGSQLFQSLASARVGQYVGVSRIDGVARLFAYRKVAEYPLVVVVGLAHDEIFQNYFYNLRIELAITLVLTLWLIGAAMLPVLYERVLAQSRDAAEAGTRARSEFLAMMSHEIRTPMNGVIGMAELLLQSGLKPEQLTYARTMRASADHLLQVINDVLDFSKLDANRVTIESVSFNLRALVTDAVSVLSADAHERGLSLVASIAPDVPSFVSGDPAKLRQVLFNLVSNGLKFTKTGGVTVALKAEPLQDGNRVRLLFEVADTGIGIPADGLPLLFREFSQLDSSIARRFGGTGLGLSICKRLIELMGGQIGVESTVGKGSIFRFVIEASIVSEPDACAPVEMASPPLVPAQGELRILLVEDNKTNQLVATRLLQGLGYDVDLATNGLEAVAACRSVAYDLVFMDVMMPEMDGLAATREIRRLAAPHSNARIIALTANAQSGDREMCLEAGMDGHVAKPLTRRSLEAIVGYCDETCATHPMSPTAEEPETSVFDAAVYAELAETLGQADTEMVMSTFLDDTRQRLAVMEAAAREDTGTLKREAHALKSSAASLGFRRLSEVAKALEGDALGLKWPESAARVDALSKEFGRVAGFVAECGLPYPSRKNREISGVNHV